MSGEKVMKQLRENRGVVFDVRPPFPHNMLVEVTNACNHHCVFCGYQNMKRPKRCCDKEIMLDIIRQAYENGTREIGFYLIGEPLMNPDLETYVAHAKDLGFEYIYLTTNGALADIERMKTLIKAGLNSVKFSVNAATPESYEFIHGHDDYEKVKKNIYDLRKYFTENNLEVPIFISFVKTKQNGDDAARLHKDFDLFVDRIYEYPCANLGDNMQTLLDKNVVEREQLISGSRVPCDMIFNRLHVTCEGYLNACCADANGYMAVIDLHETSLADAWYSDEMMALRQRHLNGDLYGMLCYNCINNANELISPLAPDLVPWLKED